jgi:putative PIN family toxin of toxin-antitoxin system
MAGRIVIDTSTLVGAALRPLSIPGKAFTLALSEFELCVSIESVNELEKVLHRDHFNVYVDLESRLTLLETVRVDAQFVLVPQSIQDETHGSCRDAKDDFILALALSARADAIVASDHDLLVLSPWRGITILTPAQFVAQFSS